MLQSSITAWLKKPASVTQADTTTAIESAPKNYQRISHTVAEVKPDNDRTEQVEPEEEITDNGASAKPFALKALPPNVELVPLTEELMPAFKRLNSTLLPIPYPRDFYTETMQEPFHGITLMALWHPQPVKNDPSLAAGTPKLVGAIRCRILPSSTLYISTIGLLSPYRSYGIATHLLHNIILKASEEHGIKSVTAHVWEANDLGLEWYKARGFEVIGEEEGYYRKLKPSGAKLVRRWIGPSDLLSGAT